MAETIHRTLPDIRGLIDFASNDYLGLSRSEALSNIFRERIHSAHGSTGSRLLTGNSEEAVQTEQWLAKHWDAGSVLIFSSGYLANLGLLSALPGRHDTILYDSLSHACIKDGCRLSLAASWSFRHNDAEHLEQRLKKAQGTPYVVVESVYSMDGDEAPLREIAECCRHYDARLIVDEAHATGIAGVHGGGLTEELDIHYFARINTFGKAIGLHGASVSGPAWLKDHLVNHSRPFIYTTAPPPFLFEQIRLTFDFLNKDRTPVEMLKRRISAFHDCWPRENGKNPALKIGNFSVQAVIVPGVEAVRAAAKALNTAGFDVRPILPPTVATGTERLRICIHSFNSEKDIRELAVLLKEFIS